MTTQQPPHTSLHFGSSHHFQILVREPPNPRGARNNKMKEKTFFFGLPLFSFFHFLVVLLRLSMSRRARQQPQFSSRCSEKRIKRKRYTAVRHGHQPRASSPQFAENLFRTREHHHIHPICRLDQRAAARSRARKQIGGCKFKFSRKKNTAVG